MSFIDNIPEDFIRFLLVTLFSLLIGLEQRRHHTDEKKESLFGMDRTFTFIGILGFVLYVAAPDNIWLFGLGALIVAGFLGIYYLKKIENFKTGICFDAGRQGNKKAPDNRVFNNCVCNGSVNLFGTTTNLMEDNKWGQSRKTGERS